MVTRNVGAGFGFDIGAAVDVDKGVEAVLSMSLFLAFQRLKLSVLILRQRSQFFHVVLSRGALHFLHLIVTRS